MADEFVSVNLSEVPQSQAYSLLSNLVVPRPIAFVSTLSASGVENLAPFSFMMLAGSNPPSIAFSPTIASSGEEKDTLRNIRETGQFVINLVTEEMALGMNATSAVLPRDESEWPRSGFSRIDSIAVEPKRVAESPVQIECVLFDVIAHGDGPGSARYVIGEAKVVHIRDDVQSTITEFHPIARLGGAKYEVAASGTTFEIKRP